MSDWPAAIARGWHPVAALSELPARRPLGVKLMGQPLAVFRAEAGVSVLRDRCPHRGAPLSQGRVASGTIACPYHGWRFAGDGACVEVPGAATCPAASAHALPVRIEAGLIWTSLAETPAAFPELPPAMRDPALDRFLWLLKPSEAGVLDALENHLDPAHPHFVHPWLVRAPHQRRRVTVTVRTGPWGGEAVYVEEHRNRALLSAVMEGRRARSSGRLWPPTIGEVRLESARGAMLSITVIFVPVDHGVTRPIAHFASTRGWLPGWFKRAALKVFHWPVLTQDRRMLRLQQQRRTAEPYVIGPLDVLGSAIWQHANARPCPDSEETRELWL